MHSRISFPVICICSHTGSDVIDAATTRWRRRLLKMADSEKAPLISYKWLDFSSTVAMFTRYISIFKFSHLTLILVLFTWRHRPSQDLSESLNIVPVRETIPEICSIFVFWHFANADRFGSSKVKGKGEYEKNIEMHLTLFRLKLKSRLCRTI